MGSWWSMTNCVLVRRCLLKMLAFRSVLGGLRAASLPLSARRVAVRAVSSSSEQELRVELLENDLQGGAEI